MLDRDKPTEDRLEYVSMEWKANEREIWNKKRLVTVKINAIHSF